jgi:hypothetical protein
MALAVLTRYAGIVLVITGGLAILFFGTKPLAKKLSDSILFGGESVLPLGIWLFRNLTVAGNATSRELIFHPIGRANLQQALTTMSSWFLIPGLASGWIKLLVVLLVVSISGLGFILTCSQHKNIPSIARVVILFVLLYFGFFFVSISFVDANTPLDNRILSPVYYSVIVLLAFALGQVIELFAGKVILTSLVSISMAILLVGFMVQSARFIRTSYQDGIGFNSKSWRQSATLAQVAALPQGIPIYSNAPEAIYIQANIPSGRLPAKYQSANLQINPHYRADLASMNDAIQGRNGVVVYFTNIVQRNTLPQPEELILDLGLRIIQKANDGIILGH